MIDEEFIQRHLVQRSLLSHLLTPAAGVYSLLQKSRMQRQLKRVIKADIPIIGIGNIVSGGSGKTPFTMALAAQMQQDGWRVAISHRGYKGRLENTPTLISDDKGVLYEVDQSGDEAWMMANALPGIPVAVGKDRLGVISLVQSLQPTVQALIMDDVFQNHRFHKDVQIACFDAELGLGNGRLIPAGYLREKPEALGRADLCVISCKTPDAVATPLLEAISPYCPWIEVLRYQPAGVYDLEGKRHEIRDLDRTVLVSGIAAASGFESLAEQAGVDVCAHFAFGDHYHFRSREALQPLLRLLNKESIRHVCTTAKDMPKLAQHRDLAPLLLELRIEPQAGQMETIWNIIKERQEIR